MSAAAERRYSSRRAHPTHAAKPCTQMKTKRLFVFLGPAFLLLFCPSICRAQLGLHWEFDPFVYEVHTDQQIFVTATFYNDSSEHLLTSGVGGYFAGDLQRHYDFQPLFGTPFVGLDLPPGESFDFVFGRLTPINGYVAPGVYFSDPAFIAVNGMPVYPDNGFEVRVAGGPPPFSTVPEPGTLPFVAALAGTAIGVAWWKRHRHLTDP